MAIREEEVEQLVEGRPDAIVVGSLLALLGFFGSLGVRFPFHRILFEAVFLFRSIRVPARWATIAYLRALQLSWLGALDEVPEAARGALKK